MQASHASSQTMWKQVHQDALFELDPRLPQPKLPATQRTVEDRLLEMRRFTMLAICLLALASLMATTAWAQSSGAHFQKKSTSAAIQSNGNLIVSWQEAGLGNFDVTYTLTANVNATYFCRTKSGNIPNANNKHTVNQTFSTNGTFSPINGKVTASLTLVAPPAPVSEPPTCGTGQTLDLQSITWSSVVLTDVTYGDVFSFGNGTFTLTLFPAP